PFTSQADRFVSLALALLDPPTGAVTIVSAGHDSPQIYRPGQPLRAVMTRKQIDVLLGIMEGYSFSAVQVALEPGDVLMLFTDGVPDASDVGNKRFGQDGVARALEGAGPLTPQGLVDRLAQAVQKHAAGRATAFDDVTLVAIGRDR